LIIVLDGLERAVSRGKHVTACDVRQRCRKGPDWAEGYVLAETWSQPADEAHREETRTPGIHQVLAASRGGHRTSLRPHSPKFGNIL